MERTQGTPLSPELRATLQVSQENYRMTAIASSAILALSAYWGFLQYRQVGVVDWLPRCTALGSVVILSGAMIHYARIAHQLKGAERGRAGNAGQDGGVRPPDPIRRDRLVDAEPPDNLYDPYKVARAWQDGWKGAAGSEEVARQARILLEEWKKELEHANREKSRNYWLSERPELGKQNDELDSVRQDMLEKLVKYSVHLCSLSITEEGPYQKERMERTDACIANFSEFLAMAEEGVKKYSSESRADRAGRALWLNWLREHVPSLDAKGEFQSEKPDLSEEMNHRLKLLDALGKLEERGFRDRVRASTTLTAIEEGNWPSFKELPGMVQQVQRELVQQARLEKFSVS